MLPALDGRQLSVGARAVTVASTVAMHGADVVFEFWDSSPPSSEVPLVGEAVVERPSGSMTAWAIPHGPAGEALPLSGPGDYQVKIYRAAAPEVQPTGGETEVPQFGGPQSYLVQILRCSTPV